MKLKYLSLSVLSLSLLMFTSIDAKANNSNVKVSPPSFKSDGGTPPDLSNVKPAGRYKKGAPPRYRQPPKSSPPPGAIAPPIGRGSPPETAPPIGSGQPPVMPMNR